MVSFKAHLHDKLIKFVFKGEMPLTSLKGKLTLDKYFSMTTSDTKLDRAKRKYVRMSVRLLRTRSLLVGMTTLSTVVTVVMVTDGRPGSGKLL